VKSILPRFAFVLTLVMAVADPSARGEAMLQLFNVSWSDVTKKMPEIAEAGYDAIWLPPPARAGGPGNIYSVGYDQYDPFDLGDNSPTRWGTKAQLQTLVQTAHRFGIRIYLDNIMNHRGFTVPGYNSGTPATYYPGLVPQDFHLQTSGNYYVNTIGIADWGVTWDVQNESLSGLVDLANEPGNKNLNFGPTLGSQITKTNFVRHPSNPEYYMDATKPVIDASFWRPFNGTNGVPVSEDVNSYLIRSVMYTLDQTKCDGFRLDAVKEVPSGFFGDSSATYNGYCGAIQAMFDCVHGYGTNACGNGYFEANDNRDSFFTPEQPRNDAMIFGELEYQSSDGGITYGDYISRGMRLINFDLRNQLNSALSGSASLAGTEQPGYVQYSGAVDPRQGVQFADNHDDAQKYAYTNHREMQDAYYLMHEGEGVIYSDGYNQSVAPSGQTPFPAVAGANYLGEYGDNQMPDICYLHNQLARGYTSPRWGDYNVCAFERYDYREGNNTQPWTQDVVLFAMNDNFGNPGDEYFFDNFGDSGSLPPSFAVPPGAAGTMQGLAVNFPIGSVLRQLATSTPGYSRTFQTVTVRTATNTKSVASANPSTYVYVGNQTIPAGGGAIEFMIPSGGWVMYGYQWPEASRANVSTNAVIFKQGGAEVPHITVTRTDGVNGDANFNPIYPFKMRGSVDPLGNVIGGVHVSNLTYAIDVPIVTNANFDIIARCDSSCANTLIKLDGGMDLNSQMGLGVTNLNGKSSDGLAPTNFPDLRDNKPGYASDVFLGYEQAAFQFRDNPEKFAAKNTLSNNAVSLGAETYYYTIGGTNQIIPGAGIGQAVDQTAAFVYHDPADTNSAAGQNNALQQRNPFAPTAGQSADIYVKIGYTNYFNTCFLYYTTDGSNPEGAFGVGKGTTKTVPASFVAGDAAAPTIQWYKATIPGQTAGTQVRYKVGAFYGGSAGGGNGAPISDANATGAKLYGLTQFAVTNFNPTTALVWLHNDLNPANVVTGLQSGFHIVRARTFLPRAGQSSVYNTFLQTFYYDGALPQGAIAYPSPDGYTINQTTYTVVVRTDGTVTGVDYNVQDGLNSNPAFYAATNVSPNSAISALYPNYPQEFRFTYTNVPSSGAATITVRLKEFATSVYTNRYTTLTRTVNTAAPTQVVQISSPSTDGTILTNALNSTYLVQACFTANLNAAAANFNVLINGVLQPQANYILRSSGSCPGMKSLYYNWNNAVVGTNLIQVIYTNTSAPNSSGQPISDARTVIVAPPLKISGLTASGQGNQTLIWDSAPGAVYQVLATTNLSQPFQVINSTPVQGVGGSTFYYDTDTNALQKFYEVQMVQ
jgi:glycosidase